MAKVHRLVSICSKQIDLDQDYNLAAVVEKGGRILSIGMNDMERTHPTYFNGKYDCGIHAEYDALRKVQDASGTNLWVFRFTKSGKLANSKPCKHCRKIIRERGLSRVFYFEDGRLVRESM